MQPLRRTTCCQRSGSPTPPRLCSTQAPTGLSCPGKTKAKKPGKTFTSIWCSNVNISICSCFLLAMKDDSIDGIYDTLKQCALISKSAGGIGLAVSCIRATGSYIAGVSWAHDLKSSANIKRVLTNVFLNIIQTNGISNGLVPMLRVYNNTARYVDQGGNKVTYLYNYSCHFPLLLLISLHESMCLEAWSLCCVPGAVARGCVWVFGAKKEHW